MPLTLPCKRALVPPTTKVGMLAVCVYLYIYVDYRYIPIDLLVKLPLKTQSNLPSDPGDLVGFVEDVRQNPALMMVDITFFVNTLQ
jgi:hypothetical protein